MVGYGSAQDKYENHIKVGRNRYICNNFLFLHFLLSLEVSMISDLLQCTHIVWLDIICIFLGYLFSFDKFNY